MQNEERQANYLARKPRLTPAQRRRLKHKRHESHDHRTRIMIEVAPGKFKKSPCPRCNPLPAVKFGGGL